MSLGNIFRDRIKKIVNYLPYFYKLFDILPIRYYNKKKLRKFKNLYLNKRCFIIGNGPSLNKIDLNLLKGEYTFGVNSIFIKTKNEGFIPTFYVVEDKHVIMDNLTEIDGYNSMIRFFPRSYKKFIKKTKNTFYFRLDTGFYNKISPYFCIPRFSADISDRIFCGQSVTMINLQLAHYMGFKEIYLIGMDHNYVIPKDAEVVGENITSNSNDPNHFDPSYFGKGKKWHDPHIDRVENSYKLMKIIFEGTGRKIFNATVGGNLEVFERINIRNLF
jgi:hypothetical protein